jgi:NAD+ kinase
MKKKIERAILHYNSSKPNSLAVKNEIKRFLKEKGIKTVERQDLALSKWGDSHTPHFIYDERHAKVKFKMGAAAKRLLAYKTTLGEEAADLLITIGGDGTLLFYKWLHSVPIFAIGSHTSFLCQARTDNWKPRLARMLKNPKIESNPMLEANFGAHTTEPSMNEISVKNPKHRMLRILLKVGKKEFKFGADGVIFCTPLGSSGYAYSAGGKEFTSKNCFGIVPIAPNRRRFKPMLVPFGTPCELKVLSRYSHDMVDVVIDGQIIYEMGLNASLKIQKSKKQVMMLR